MLGRYFNLCAEDILKFLSDLIEKAERAQRSSTTEGDRRRTDEYDEPLDLIKKIGDIVTEEKVQAINESEPIDKDIMVMMTNLSERISKLNLS